MATLSGSPGLPDGSTEEKSFSGDEFCTALEDSRRGTLGRSNLEDSGHGTPGRSSLEDDWCWAPLASSSSRSLVVAH